MKKLILVVFLLIPFCFFSCESPKKQPPAREAVVVSTGPVSVILDTDMGPDVDDAGALAMLHAFADEGEARILGVMSSNPNQWAAPTIDAINTYFGRGDLPIGAPKTDGVIIANTYGWNEKLVPRYPHNLDSTQNATEAVATYRKILAAEPDSGVTIVCIGFLTNLQHLLNSTPDDWSPLPGTQLIARKVKRLVVMGGKFPQGKEFNLELDPEAAMAVADRWPTPIVFSGFEIGEKVLTGRELLKDSTLANNPVRFAYQYFLEKDKTPNRPSWDQTAVWVAVRGLTDHFEAISGQCRVYSDGRNEWVAITKGTHQYLRFKTSPEKVRTDVEELMRHAPK